MYVVEACPSCGSTRHDAYPALVSPFLASYVLEAPPAPTRLLECEACGLRFFEDRLTDAEAKRLYSGYRGDAYYRVRHRCEPWYTRKVNDAIGGDDALMGARRETIEHFLRDHTDVSKIEAVLDFGGDRGQVIPASIGREKFVYEISGMHPVSGVSRIGSAKELEGRRFDLVLLCHVLEHCSEPKAVVDEARGLLRTKESLLLVELPYERASLQWLGRRAGYRAYLSALRRVRPLLTAVDLYSTAFRLRGTVPPLGFVKLHEHVNFFDEGSIRALIERSGLEVLSVQKGGIRSVVGLDSILFALARLR